MILSLKLAALARFTMAFSARMKAWLMENSPIRAQVMLMPLYRESWPNMNRSTPCMGSMPMVERTSPKAPLISPRIMESVLMPAMIVRPNRLSQKYSGLPNSMASRARAGAKKYREMQLRRPPQKEAMQAVASAFPALPFRVMA